MSRLGRWSFVCTCGFTCRSRSRAAIHVTTHPGHHIEGLS